MSKKTILVLSGGQDSVTCLGLALHRGDDVTAFSFDYGQRHSVELSCAHQLCDKLGIEHELIEIPFLHTGVTSALNNDDGDSGKVAQPHNYMKGLPASFVPCRNALFLTMAFGAAMERSADNVMTGVCQTDYSGYPDCREPFVRMLEHSLNEGYLSDIRIETPMMHLTKAETFLLAERVSFLDNVIEMSHTCYNGDHSTKHAWGYGCGECPACKIRKAGWNAYEARQYDAGKVQTLLD